MATATKPKFEPETAQESNLKFKGPANQEFGSFFEQANYFLDNYCPKWKEYSDHQSYVFPPIFKFKHQDVSDEAFKEFEKSEEGKRKIHAIINNRVADEAEFLVYETIQQLKLHDTSFGPFVAIRSLDLHLNYDQKKKKVCGLLTKIFPNFDWDKFHLMLGKDNAEYDFLIIGPKIGIIVIEVKSATFDGASDFTENERSLPGDYKKGLNQLKSSDALIIFLQGCTGLSATCGTKKVLFTPNLERRRYECWFKNLPESAKVKATVRIDEVTQWFKEDVQQSIDVVAATMPHTQHQIKARSLWSIFKQNFQSRPRSMSILLTIPLFAISWRVNLFLSKHLKPRAYSYMTVFAVGTALGVAKGVAVIKLIQLVKKHRQQSNNAAKATYYSDHTLNKSHVSSVLKQALQLNSLDHHIYELYCPILTGIASANLSSKLKTNVEMNRLDFSEVENAQILNSCLANHNLLQEQKSQKPSTASGLKPLKLANGKKQTDKKKIYYLTPDQQMALNGPIRQVIFGVAGTGKTVVLQAKAVELLTKEASILVIAPENFVLQYESLFNSYGFKNGDVMSFYESELYLYLCSHIMTMVYTLKHDCSLTDFEKFVEVELKSSGYASIENSFKKYNNILIDDSWDLFQHERYGSLVSETGIIFFVMLLLSKLFPSKLIWIVVDPVSGPTSVNMHDRLHFHSLIEPKVIQQEEIFGYRITMLTRVLRCTSNMFDFVYNFDGSSLSVSEQLLPVLGHKINGIKRTPSIIENYETFNEAKLALEPRVCDAIGKLLVQNVALTDIAVIIEGMGGRAAISKIIKEKWPSLKVEAWDDVSSLEWPFVLFVRFVCNKYQLQNFAKYRAASRSTTQLIIICVTHIQDERSCQEWTVTELTELAKASRKISLINPKKLNHNPARISDIVNEFYSTQQDEKRNEFEIEEKLYEISKDLITFLKQFELYKRSGRDKPPDPQPYILELFSGYSEMTRKLLERYPTFPNPILAMEH